MPDKSGSHFPKLVKQYTHCCCHLRKSAISGKSEPSLVWLWQLPRFPTLATLWTAACQLNCNVRDMHFLIKTNRTFTAKIEHFLQCQNKKQIRSHLLQMLSKNMHLRPCWWTIRSYTVARRSRVVFVASKIAWKNISFFFIFSFWYFSTKIA